MTSFADVLARLAPTGDALAIATPEDWAQGRTLYGGMTAALAHAAATRAFPDPPPLRAAQFAFVGPAAGALRFIPTRLRQGKATTIVAVDCIAQDVLAARATFLFGAARDSAIRHDRVVAPAVPPPDECPAFYETTRPLPGFLANFEYRLAAGSRLFRPGDPPEFAVWVRFRDACGDDPVTALLALADATPCAAMANFPKLAPVSTLSWSLDLHQPPAADDGWRLVTTSSEAATDGYSLQAMRVFAADGAPLVAARQVVAIFA